MSAALPDASSRAALRWLSDDLASAVCVLWASGLFSTWDISQLLNVPENAVDRTLRLAREGRR
jgi:DNA-directed RNA polymerase specialized sigma24 family protein